MSSHRTPKLFKPISGPSFGASFRESGPLRTTAFPIVGRGAVTIHTEPRFQALVKKVGLDK